MTPEKFRLYTHPEKNLEIVFNLSLINISIANFDVKARTAILQDYLSGEILFEKDADKSIYPASMTKIMTAIIAFDLIRSGDLNLDEKFLVSENAWRLSSAGYSSMFIMVGDEVSVENLLKGIIIASGNDACVALAEGIAGTCLLYTSPSPRDATLSRMPSSA